MNLEWEDRGFTQIRHPLVSARYERTSCSVFINSRSTLVA